MPTKNFIYHSKGLAFTIKNGIDKIPTRRNFMILAFMAVSERIGWIFKTESVIIPGFIQYLGGSGTVRGMLPLISRFGRSFPQFVIAHWIKKLPYKRPSLFVFSLIMALVWGSLAGVIFLFPHSSNTLILLIFFAVYTLHWIVNGVVILLQGVIQGKLIAANRRGRLLAWSNTLGCFLAIAAAYFLIERWLDKGNTGYGLAFVTTFAFFLASPIMSLFLKEWPDEPEEKKESFAGFVASSIGILRVDRNFRRLIYVNSMFYAFHFLFPHYTAFGAEALGLGEGNFLSLLIAQNAVNALGSLLMGNVADRKGNKIVLSILIGAIGFVPLMAIGIASLPPLLGIRLYWIVFACIGFTPVLMRIIINYVLEICPQEKHSQYLGTLNLVLIVPTMASPLVGLAIDRFSFRPVFIATSIIVFGAAILSLKLDEPRSKKV